MKITFETALYITAAVVLVIVIGWVMRLKTKGFTRLLVNSLAGGALVLGLSAFGIISLPFNPFNALLVGVLGLPGAGVVIAAALIL